VQRAGQAHDVGDGAGCPGVRFGQAGQDVVAEVGAVGFGEDPRDHGGEFGFEFFGERGEFLFDFVEGEVGRQRRGGAEFRPVGRGEGEVA
jgi:hypothetical protein